MAIINWTTDKIKNWYFRYSNIINELNISNNPPTFLHLELKSIPSMEVNNPNMEAINTPSNKGYTIKTDIEEITIQINEYTVISSKILSNLLLTFLFIFLCRIINIPPIRIKRTIIRLIPIISFKFNETRYIRKNPNPLKLYDTTYTFFL